MRIAALTFVFFFISSTLLLAQEICNNQIDDDDDGQIDLADCDCYSNRGNVWHFGAGYGVDFNGNNPVNTPTSIETPEGSSAICDEEGNLLFYTNGGGRPPDSGQNPGIIWNANNEVMYDMQGAEGGGWSAAQSAVIIEKPGSTTNYYLFTMEEGEFPIGGEIPGQEQGRGLSLFEIDMTANGGLGEVVLADERIFVPAYEIVVAIQHDNGEDYWIIVLREEFDGNRNFVVFSITANGIEEAGTYTYSMNGEFFFYVKASPARDKIAEWADNSVAFYDFDASTGVMSNRVQVSLPSVRQGEFSPSGKFFYAVEFADVNSSAKPVFRIPMENVSPSSSFEQISQISSTSFFPFGQWQLGPDGNIYFLFEQTFLGKIECPDTDDPSVIVASLSLIGNSTSEFFGRSLGLPNFPNHFFYRPPLELEITGQEQYELCAGETVTLEVEANKCSDFRWNNGFTTSSILVDEPGIYSVTVTAEDCEEEVLTVEVLGENVSDIAIEGPSNACVGSTIALSANLPEALSISWQSIDGTTLSNDSDITLTIEQDTLLQLIAELNCDDIIQEVFIEALDIPAPDLIVNNAGCNAPLGTAAINNAVPAWTINWLDSNEAVLSTDSFIENLEPGDYQVLVFTTANAACATTLDFSVRTTAPFTVGPVDMINNICPGDELGSLAVTDITGTPPFSIQWTA
ncbi:MAG: hypothetical protein AAF798_12815, partial [Bacteroidota bacterium]